jgi:hypothetical protein
VKIGELIAELVTAIANKDLFFTVLGDIDPGYLAKRLLESEFCFRGHPKPAMPIRAIDTRTLNEDRTKARPCSGTRAAIQSPDHDVAT